MALFRATHFYEMAYTYQNMYTNEVFAITESSTAVLAILESAPKHMSK